MPTVGPIYASSIASFSSIDGTWSNTNNAVGSTTGTYAVWTSSVADGVDEIILQYTNDGIAIPYGSVITAVDASVRSLVSSTTLINLHRGFVRLNGVSVGGAVLTRSTTVAERPVNLTSLNTPLSSSADAIQFLVEFWHNSTTSSASGSLDRVALTITYETPDTTGFFF